jgi:hypothetical protein
MPLGLAVATAQPAQSSRAGGQEGVQRRLRIRRLDTLFARVHVD